MEFRVHDNEVGISPLELLRRRIPAAPPAYLRNLLRSGKVRRGEGVPDSPLRAGETVRLPDSARLQELKRQSEETPEILFESREVLAVYKPSGLAVHRGVGHEEDNLVLRVERLMAHRGAPFRTSPVHRLDAETSGPVLFAKGRRAAAALGKLFMAGEVEKIYIGLVIGAPHEAGRLDAPVRAKGKVKAAETVYEVLATNQGLSLLELRLLSGRTHQIRRHLAEAGHPLAGDRRYCGAQIPGMERLFLHCRRLALTDPFSGSLLELDSPLPGELAGVLEYFGLLRPSKGSP